MNKYVFRTGRAGAHGYVTYAHTLTARRTAALDSSPQFPDSVHSHLLLSWGPRTGVRPLWASASRSRAALSLCRDSPLFSQLMAMSPGCSIPVGWSPGCCMPGGGSCPEKFSSIAIFGASVIISPPHAPAVSSAMVVTPSVTVEASALLDQSIW